MTREKTMQCNFLLKLSYTTGDYSESEYYTCSKNVHINAVAAKSASNCTITKK